MHGLENYIDQSVEEWQERIDRAHRRARKSRRLGLKTYNVAMGMMTDAVSGAIDYQSRMMTELTRWHIPKIRRLDQTDEEIYSEFEIERSHTELITLASGEQVMMRAPTENDREGLVTLYRNMSEIDRNMRFFAPTSTETAIKSGMRCSSIDCPDDCRDFVVVNGDDTVIAVGGYTLMNGVAEPHVYVDEAHRHAATAGESGLGESLMVQSIRTAQVDPSVDDIVIEVLTENRKMTQLLIKKVLGGHPDEFILTSRAVSYGVLEAHIKPSELEEVA